MIPDDELLTVDELIEMLETMPGDAPVFIENLSALSECRFAVYFEDDDLVVLSEEDPVVSAPGSVAASALRRMT